MYEANYGVSVAKWARVSCTVSQEMFESVGVVTLFSHIVITNNEGCVLILHLGLKLVHLLVEGFDVILGLGEGDLELLLELLLLVMVLLVIVLLALGMVLNSG